jgi:hypothetical protein
VLLSAIRHGAARDSECGGEFGGGHTLMGWNTPDDCPWSSDQDYYDAKRGPFERREAECEECGYEDCHCDRAMLEEYPE